jgi:hypothetical protein
MIKLADFHVGNAATQQHLLFLDFELQVRRPLVYVSYASVFTRQRFVNFRQEVKPQDVWDVSRKWVVSIPQIL